MQQQPVEYLGATRIQVLYPDKTASFRLSAEATVVDIASALNVISKHRPDRPVAIYVTLKRPD